MADYDLGAIQTAIENLVGKSPALTAAFDKIRVSAQSLADMNFDSITKGLGSLGDTLKQTANSTDQLRDHSLAAGNAFDVMAKGFGLVTAMTSKLDGFREFQTAGLSINSMSSAFEGLVTRMGGWEAASKKLV